jgi:hypothetical protein
MQCLRKGSAGSNTAADHMEIVDASIAALRPAWRRNLMVTVDGSGFSHKLVEHLDALARRRGYTLVYSCGWELDAREKAAIRLVPQEAWQIAIDHRGEVRERRADGACADIECGHRGCWIEEAHVTELTGLLREGPDGDRCCRRGHLRDGPALTMYRSVLSGFVKGGDHGAGHARPAGLARLRDVINSWLEETSFRAALTACAAALVLIGAAVAFALLVPGHGTAGGPGTVPGVARSDLAGAAAPPGAAPASSPQPRAIAVPSASPATPDPAPPSPAASPAVPVTSPVPAATRSLPGCRHGHRHGRHGRC